MSEINEDRNALEVIARLDERVNLERQDVNGKKKAVIREGYSWRHLFVIEKFVIDIERIGWQRGCEERTSHYTEVKGAGELHLVKVYYCMVNGWLKRYSEKFRYSARVDVFYEVCRELCLIGEYPVFFYEPDDIACADGRRYIDLFTDLIERIRKRCRSREFRERERLRLASAARNRGKVLAMERAMFSKDAGRSRWLVLSLTLRYRSQFSDAISVHDIQLHRDRFFAARRANKLMSGIKNYVWAIEQGEQTGLHLHVILFYSAAGHNRDEFIAQQVAEYWVNVVTDGKGDYWNSNDTRLKAQYEKYGHGTGVGQINWNEGGRRNALRRNLVYLAKADQYLVIKGMENVRTFGMGHVPMKLKSGRPRTASLRLQ